jgi:Choline dehydrogenase and related flavoproteins
LIVDLADIRLPGAVDKKVCVVGTGIGGGSFIARYLKDKGDMVVIEAGSKRENADVTGESVGRDFGLAMTREISLGGTSNAWRSLCSPLDRIDFVGRRWMNMSGWPIGPSDLNPHYAEAARLLDLPEFSRFASARMEPGTMALAHAFDFDRNTLENKFFLQTRPPRNFRDELLQRFQRSDDLLLMNAVAVEIVTNREGNVAEKILVKAPGGDSVEIRAKHFVLAAGALGTPRLLLNSRRWNGKGVGNDHDLAGRFLMDHPMGSLSQLRLDRIRRAPLYHSVKIGPKHYMKAGFVLTEEMQEKYRLPNHCFYLLPSFHRGIDDRFEKLRRNLITARKRRLKPGDILALVSSPNTLYRILTYLFPIEACYLYADLFFVTEQVPNRNSTVSLSEKKDRFGYPIARIDWKLTQEDLDSIAAFNEVALNALATGGTRIFFRKTKDRIGESLTSAAHHMGTARMAAGARSGVVDRDLKVWGVDNLHICDASVFPTSGNANPALTISALAIRLADRLADLPS